MKIKYVFEQEEITTCNSCPFRQYVENDNKDHCCYPGYEGYDNVTDFCFDFSIPFNCPLIRLD